MTRLDPDNAEAVEEYLEELDVTKAEATRRLIRSGLDQLENDEQNARALSWTDLAKLTVVVYVSALLAFVTVKLLPLITVAP